jgi:hypothetical protein
MSAIYGWLPQFPAANAAAGRLLEHCRNELQTATVRPIEPPKDWAREADLGCKCADYRDLAAFLRDPAARVGRFPLRKDRQQHLHGIIDGSHCDCTHIPDRHGSPQTLVCTKTQASYERRLKQYESDLATLEKLATIGNGKKVKAAPRGGKAAKAVPKKRKMSKG